MTLSADLSKAKSAGRIVGGNMNISSPGRSNKPLWPRRNTRWMSGYLMALVASLWIVPASAVLLEFQNCLSDAIQNDQPLALQIIPLYLNAVFNTTDTNHNLNVTVWGNVTGSTVGTNPKYLVPPANDTQYWNSNETTSGGKIENEPYPDDPIPKLTTLSSKVNVLTYEPWHNPVNFCEDGLLNGTCPLGPTFSANL